MRQNLRRGLTKRNGLRLCFVFLLLLLSGAWKWPPVSLKRSDRPLAKAVWAIDTIPEKTLKPQIAHNSPPLITEDLVVQGNFLNGVKAYNKDSAQRVWFFKIPSGVASPLALYKGNIYFGGADGFFYSLQLKTGRLNWKFWTGSKNSGPPLIDGERLYWTNSHQKTYAFSLKGKRLWLYSGPSLPGDFAVRGASKPAIYKNWIYIGFYDGSIAILNKKTGRLKKTLSLSSDSIKHPIRENLEISGNCLFAPVFNFHLFCLNPLKGSLRWKRPGGSSYYLSDPLAFYHYHKGWLWALERGSKKILWKKKSPSWLWPVSVFKSYLVYGSPSHGELFIARQRDGRTLARYKFGRGLAAPVAVDEKNSHIYFLSIDGYLHKLSVSFFNPRF